MSNKTNTYMYLRSSKGVTSDNPTGKSPPNIGFKGICRLFSSLCNLEAGGAKIY
jgi:hypothetical protein